MGLGRGFERTPGPPQDPPLEANIKFGKEQKTVCHSALNTYTVRLLAAPIIFHSLLAA